MPIESREWFNASKAEMGFLSCFELHKYYLNPKVERASRAPSTLCPMTFLSEASLQWQDMALQEAQPEGMSPSLTTKPWQSRCSQSARGVLTSGLLCWILCLREQPRVPTTTLREPLPCFIELRDIHRAQHSPSSLAGNRLSRQLRYDFPLQLIDCPLSHGLIPQF